MKTSILSSEDIKSSSVIRFIEIYDSIPINDLGQKLWPKVIDRYGYGIFSVSLKNGKRATVTAHKLAYLIFVGDLKEGEVVRHKNDVRNDVNYENLLAGSQLDNMRDAKERGRLNLEKLHAYIRGSGRFSDEDIFNIKKLVSEGESQRSVARKYNVSYSMINLIVNNKRY